MRSSRSSRIALNCFTTGVHRWSVNPWTWNITILVFDLTGSLILALDNGRRTSNALYENSGIFFYRVGPESDEGFLFERCRGRRIRFKYVEIYYFRKPWTSFRLLNGRAFNLMNSLLFHGLLNIFFYSLAYTRPRNAGPDGDILSIASHHFVRAYGLFSKNLSLFEQHRDQTECNKNAEPLVKECPGSRGVVNVRWNVTTDNRCCCIFRSSS